MKNQQTSGITAAEVMIEFSNRVRKGYDPAMVDAHLRYVAQGVAELQTRLAESGEDDESLGLVLRATRRSVDEALAEARQTADVTVSDAEQRATRMVTEAEERATRTVMEADEHATRTVTEADERATRTLADAESRSEALNSQTEERARVADAKARERYAELGRLLEVREVELEALDSEIERRQEILRAAGNDLIELADGFIDLRDGDEPTADHAPVVDPRDAPDEGAGTISLKPEIAIDLAES